MMEQFRYLTSIEKERIKLYSLTWAVQSESNKTTLCPLVKYIDIVMFNEHLGCLRVYFEQRIPLNWLEKILGHKEIVELRSNDISFNDQAPFWDTIMSMVDSEIAKHTQRKENSISRNVLEIDQRIKELINKQ